jgi:hypothetical protein
MYWISLLAFSTCDIAKVFFVSFSQNKSRQASAALAKIKIKLSKICKIKSCRRVLIGLMQSWDFAFGFLNS